MRRERAKLLNFYLNVSTFWTFKDDSRLFEVGLPLSPWMERPSAMMPVEGKYDAFMACRYAYDKKQAHGASVVMATALLSEDIRFLSKWSRASLPYDGLWTDGFRDVILESVAAQTGCWGGEP